MIVTFNPSPHYDENLYCNEYVEKTTNCLIQIQQEKLYLFIVKSILDLNVDSAESWQCWVKKEINAYGDNYKEFLKQVCFYLFHLKKISEQNSENYLAVLVPRLFLKKLEQRFGEVGSLDVFISIQKNINSGVNIWRSADRVGSNTVDSAIWNNHLQSGACYECKLGTPQKQAQIDLLYCISCESEQKIEVGIASFSSDEAMKKKLLSFEMPPIIKVVTRRDIFRY